MIKRFATILLGAFIALNFTASVFAQNTFPELTPDNTLYIDTKSGTVKIQLLPDVAPEHVKRIKTLAAKGFYDNIVFHRVIAGFMAQTGDPTGTGTGGSDLADLKAEFSNKYTFSQGVVGMARSGHPDSANSQFFIMLDDGPFLDNKYTIFGVVVDGMDNVHKIKKGAGSSGAVKNPDQMLKVYQK